MRSVFFVVAGFSSYYHWHHWHYICFNIFISFRNLNHPALLINRTTRDLNRSDSTTLYGLPSFVRALVSNLNFRKPASNSAVVPSSSATDDNATIMANLTNSEVSPAAANLTSLNDFQQLSDCVNITNDNNCTLLSANLATDPDILALPPETQKLVIKKKPVKKLPAKISTRKAPVRTAQRKPKPPPPGVTVYKHDDQYKQYMVRCGVCLSICSLSCF